VSRALAVVLAIGIGCLVGMQAPVNSRLGKSVGNIQAATFSFLVGTVALVVIASVAAQGGLSSLRHVGQVPWWALVGGLFGAVYVAVSLVAVRTLGASGLTAAVIAGQLAISAVIDRFGLVGIGKQQLGPVRILGLFVLAAGVLLVVRR
jgi:bacterial/archaeal transporter family-2 protein